VLALLLLVGCGEGLPERHLAATRQAEESAVKVEATRQHLDQQATAQAVAISATATAAAVASEGEELRLERERQLQPVRTWGWVIFGVSVVTAVGAVGWRFTEVLADRARLVRRQPDEGESILLIRTADGHLAYDLPLRHPTSSSARLADPEEQAQATMRQQTANALQARQAAKIVAARHGQDTTRKVLMIPAPQSRRAIRRPGQRESGLVGVAQLSELDGAIEAGMLPKQLANAINAEWQEVTRDDQD
jgi:sRNA-binding protein